MEFALSLMIKSKFTKLLLRLNAIRKSFVFTILVISVLLLVYVGFLVAVAVGGLFEEGITLDMLTSYQPPEINLNEIDNVSAGGVSYLTGGIDYTSLPDISTLTLGANDYKPTSLKESLMLRELAIEICSRPEIDMDPRFLLGIWYTECSLNMQLKDSNSDIYNSLSTINESKSTKYKGPGQTSQATMDSFNLGYISKAESPNLDSSLRVFGKGDVSNVLLNPDGISRPNVYYVPDAMYLTAWRISRTLHGLDQFSKLDSPAQMGKEVKKVYQKFSGLSDVVASNELNFLLAAHIYNGVRIPTMYSLTADMYLQAYSKIGYLSNFYDMPISTRQGMKYFMTGSPSGSFSTTTPVEPFNQTLAEMIGYSKVSELQEDYKFDYNKDSLEFWTYGMFSLNAGTNIMKSLDNIFNQVYKKQASEQASLILSGSSEIKAYGVANSRVGIVKTSLQFLGNVPYRLGGKYSSSWERSDGIDCSGFVNMLYKLTFNDTKIDFGGTANMYSNFDEDADTVDMDSLRPGDILLVSGSELGSSSGHTGMFVGYVGNVPIAIHSGGYDVQSLVNGSVYSYSDGVVLSPIIPVSSEIKKDIYYHHVEKSLGLHAYRLKDYSFVDDSMFLDKSSYTFNTISELVNFYLMN